MDAFEDLARIGPQDIWQGVAARAVHGRQITFSVVELEPDAVVPEHRHENEQLGMVLAGSLTFRVGDESQRLGPGGTWRIPADTPHEVVTGPDGAVVIDVFAPPREDWSRFEPRQPREPRWP